ncbi:MAG TPA: DUF4968 domain-containing protein, partial [Actinotalea sp.]|nr:DUF4968 domain-containing protein [Actinotalea sp.]
MIDLSAYRRTLAVDEVRSTATGLTARAGAERLEIDAVRPDVVRIRLSRGGRFDAPPTHAVVAEPEPVAVEVAVHPGRATVATDELTVTLQRDPFVLTVARSDGTVVLRTATDPDDGSSWAYATLNDSWVSRRDLGPGQVYGLGERTGGSDRRGRRVIPWNTDVRDPHRTAEFTAGYPSHDPRSDRTSTAFDPYYVGIPLWYHRDPATGATGACFLDNAYRSAVDLTGQGCDLELAVDGGQWCEYVFAGPSIEQVLGAYTW